MSAVQGRTSEQGTQLLQEYVYRALISKSNGTDPAAYAGFVRDFINLRKKVEREPNGNGLLMLANIINALRDCVSALKERQHDAILSEVLGIKLWGVAPVVRGAVLEFVSTLVVVNTAFTHTCLRLLVSALQPPPAPPATPEQGLAPWTPTEDEVMVQTAVTTSLIRILERVPTAPVALMQLVTSSMPHKLRDRSSQCLYFSALYGLAEAEPAGRSIRDAVLISAVEHLMSLDVDIKWEDIVDTNTLDVEEEVEGDKFEDLDDIFELEGMTELDLNATPEELERLRQERLASHSQAGPRGGWEGAGNATMMSVADGPPTVDETANKLDSLMELTFAHLEKRCQSSEGGLGKVNRAALLQTWAALMTCFERTILNTHRSKFSQFLVFFVCYKHPEPCVRLFLEFLLSRLHDNRLPGITRSACAAYLASFLARCSAIPLTLILQSLDSLTTFVEQYLASTDAQEQFRRQNSFAATITGAALAEDTQDLTTRHQVLYAAVQAILYVMCYHLESLVHHQHQHHHKQSVGDAVKALLKNRLLPLLNHRLQPLVVCLPSVVAEFKTQLASHGIADVSMPTPVEDQGSRAVQRPLEMFFPFDPYLLKRSSKYLELHRSYVKWTKGHARGTGRAADDSQSDLEAGDDAKSTAAQNGLEDEDEDLHSSASDSEDASSDTTEDESLRGGSLISDHGMMARLRVPSSAAKRAIPMHPNGIHHHHRGQHGLARHALDPGNASMASHGHAPMIMGTSYDPMATSYGTGAMSSMGDGTPALGSSPVLVDYYDATAHSLGTSVSPMQMTPHVYGQHMDGIPSRLAGKLR